MLIVQKYGGTSVGNPERIKNVARRVVRTREEGHDVVVVVSAMSGETDKLINLASQVSENPDPREMDMLVSTGERVTIALLAMAIQSLGHKAQSFTGRQAGIISDSVHTKARIEKITGERLKQALKEGKIAVVAGFQGITEQDDVSTLGRGRIRPVRSGRCRRAQCGCVRYLYRCGRGLYDGPEHGAAGEKTRQDIL